MEDDVLARGVRPEGPGRWYFVLGGEGVDDCVGGIWMY